MRKMNTIQTELVEFMLVFGELSKFFEADEIRKKNENEFQIYVQKIKTFQGFVGTRIRELEETRRFNSETRDQPETSTPDHGGAKPKEKLEKTGETEYEASRSEISEEDPNVSSFYKKTKLQFANCKTVITKTVKEGRTHLDFKDPKIGQERLDRSVKMLSMFAAIYGELVNFPEFAGESRKHQVSYEAYKQKVAGYQAELKLRIQELEQTQIKNKKEVNPKPPSIRDLRFPNIDSRNPLPGATGAPKAPEKSKLRSDQDECHEKVKEPYRQNINKTLKKGKQVMRRL
jgi:hypothetical protein